MMRRLYCRSPHHHSHIHTTFPKLHETLGGRTERQPQPHSQLTQLPMRAIATEMQFRAPSRTTTFVANGTTVRHNAMVAKANQISHCPASGTETQDLCEWTPARRNNNQITRNPTMQGRPKGTIYFQISPSTRILLNLQIYE